MIFNRSTPPSLPAPLSKVSVRIVGIDTPELRGKCDAEKIMAADAKAKLLQIIGASDTMIVKNVSWDKFGGRIDGKVFLKDGTALRLEMIKSGLARPYSGGFRKQWCD